MIDWKIYAIGALTISLLISLGFNVPMDATHFCRALELPKHCDRLSSTLGRCYPLPGTTMGYKDCSSKWELLAKEPEKQADSLKVRVQANGGSYECGCCDLTSYTPCVKNDGKQAYLGELI